MCERNFKKLINNSKKTEMMLLWFYNNSYKQHQSISSRLFISIHSVIFSPFPPKNSVSLYFSLRISLILLSQKPFALKTILYTFSKGLLILRILPSACSHIATVHSIYNQKIVFAAVMSTPYAIEWIVQKSV